MAIAHWPSTLPAQKTQVFHSNSQTSRCGSMYRCDGCSLLHLVYKYGLCWSVWHHTSLCFYAGAGHAWVWFTIVWGLAKLMLWIWMIETVIVWPRLVLYIATGHVHFTATLVCSWNMNSMNMSWHVQHCLVLGVMIVLCELLKQNATLQPCWLEHRRFKACHVGWKVERSDDNILMHALQCQIWWNRRWARVFAIQLTAFLCNGWVHDHGDGALWSCQGVVRASCNPWLQDVWAAFNHWHHDDWAGYKPFQDDWAGYNPFQDDWASYNPRLQDDWASYNPFQDDWAGGNPQSQDDRAGHNPWP